MDTAVGPRSMGGLGNMDWKAHVTAIRAHWVQRYIHPADAAWKIIIDELMLTSKDGSYKFGSNRGALMTPLSPLDKSRLLHGIPANAKYWRECLKAHWKINYQFDTTQPPTGGEPLWESPRFIIQAPRRTRQYLINTLQITQLTDIINKDTETTFTDDEWAAWIRELHMQHAHAIPSEHFVTLKVADLLNIIAQIPADIIAAISTPSQWGAQENSIVALTAHDTDAQEHDVYYAQYSTTTEGGTKLDLLHVDTVGKWHQTGAALTPLHYETHQVEFWKGKGGHRIIGPKQSTFPLMEGWKIGDTQIRLDGINIKTLTSALTARRFKPPAAELGWQSRLHSKFNANKLWRMKSFFCTPRDTVTWLKLQHRNLYTASRDPESNGQCAAYSALENQIHLAACPIINTWVNIVTNFIARVKYGV